MSKRPVLVVSLVSLCAGVGCSGSTATEDPGGGGGGEPLPTTGSYYRYVVDDLILPGSGAAAGDLAFDLDATGDADNALGSILSLLKGVNVDLQPQVDAAILSGDIVSLHEVRADDLSADDSTSWEAFLGMPMSDSPKFDGTDDFTRDARVATEPLIGSIAGGVFEGGPGEISISLTVGAASIDVTLRAARVEARMTEAGGDGKVGGGVSLEEIDREVLPAVAGYVGEMVSNDCTGGAGSCSCASGSIGKTIQEFFDENGDCAVSADELRNHSLVEAALNPDVDLIGDDGQVDSMSFGVGIHIVKASFDSPNE